MNTDLLERAADLSRLGQPFALATVVRAERPTSAKAGASAMITADGSLSGWVGGSCAQPTVIREALKTLQDGRPRFLRLCPPEQLGRASQDGVTEVALTCISGGTLEVYIEPHQSQPHLIAVGHLPVAEAVAALGKALGYAVTVMGFDATPARFPHVDHLLDHLDFSGIGPAQGPRTYVVVASHGNYDEEALAGALGTSAAYVALVASRRRAESILAYLRDSGVSEADLTRLKYPAGLDIGAVTPDEIAVSILAEIVQVRRQAQSAARPAVIAQASAQAVDPVCGMTVEIATARYTSEYDGQTYYFCAASCKRSFEKEPQKYLAGRG